MSSDDRRRAIGKVTSVAADRFVIEMLGGGGAKVLLLQAVVRER